MVCCHRYFEQLEIQTIRCNLTLIPRMGLGDSDIAPGRIRMAAALGGCASTLAC